MQVSKCKLEIGGATVFKKIEMKLFFNNWNWRSLENNEFPYEDFFIEH